MMEKKNIDRLFQEKFRDFEANPPEEVWYRIEEELEKKKKRRAIPIWWKLSGVAALFLVGIAIWMMWRANPDGETGVVTSPENLQTQPVEIKPGREAVAPLIPAPGSRIDGVAGSENNWQEKSGSQLQNHIQDGLNDVGDEIASEQDDKPDMQRESANKSPVLNRPKTSRVNRLASPGVQPEGTVAASELKKGSQNRDKDYQRPEKTQLDPNGEPLPETKIADAEDLKNISPDNQAGPERILSVQEPEEAIAVQDASVKKDSVVIAAAEPNALEELLKEKEEEKKVTSESNLNRWQITSNVAPIYFSSASNGSPIDSRLQDANKSYKTSFSYGAGVQYALNKRLSVRSGVNALSLEYSTTDIFFMQTPNAKQLQNVNSNLRGSLIQVESNPGMLTASMGRGDRRYDGVLNQRIGYIEVPVEMSYQILQKRLGITVIGGVSTLFLNQNDVSIEGAGLNMTIGEANNLNPLHFSTNLGLGIKYDFLKSLEFKVEPIVKYQLNTFSNDSGNFKPFFLGVYTGLNYRF